MIDKLTIDKIHEAAQILDVVSDFVTLRKSGANYKGLCPFHDDRTPSFIVSPAKNYCKCFACGKGGSPVGFIMEHEQLSYPEALRYLARKYGIEIKEKELSSEERAAQSERESMFLVNEWALSWFRQQMNETQDGRAVGLAYFRERGFRDDIISKFQLGYCPSARDSMTRTALREGYSEHTLTATGLTIRYDDGTLTDRFRGRVIFPWHTISGKVAGFGGRVLDAATKGVAVKYQNSPESPIYSKRRELYGLYQAKQAIVRADQVYMVEGYTDVISMHQCGIENVVANSGTALTPEQVHLLHRFTSNITLLYDGDQAGIHAAQRGTDMLLADGMNLKILLLPDGDDPDSFARKHDAAAFRQYIEQHQVDFIRFKTDLMLSEARNDPNRLSLLVDDIVTSIACIPNEITRSIYIRETSAAMHLDEQMIQRAVQRQMSKRREEEYRRRNSPQPQASSPLLPQGTAANAVPVSTGETGNANEGGNVTSGNDASGNDASGNTVSAGSTSETVDVSAGTLQPRDPITRAELLLAQMIVRYGERKACDAEDENGQCIPLSVCEFIYYSMEQDELSFTHPLAATIMQKALKHVHDQGFMAEKYFLWHKDQQLSQAAFTLSTDREELSKFHSRGQQQDTSEPHLLELTTHLLADLKIAVVRRDITNIMAEMKHTNSDNKARELLIRYKELKEAEKRLAKECGDRVLV